MYLVTAREMQEMDRRTIEDFGIPGRVLMENAGRGATRAFLRDIFAHSPGKVGVMAGRGNNGGDGFVMARYLAEKDIPVTVFLLSEKGRVSGDAADNLNLLGPLNVPVVEMPDEKAFKANLTLLRHQEIWIDAILGTGLNSDVRGFFKQVIEFINLGNRPVFSVDIPSGLNSDTGQVCGTCIRATATATFACAKIGHQVHPGVDHTGELTVVNIGIPGHISKAVNPRQYLLTESSAAAGLEKRAPDSHKGTTGHVLVISGATGKTGAAAMTAMSALRAGAGLVTVGIPVRHNATLENQVIEAMTVPLPETANGALDLKAFDAVMALAEDKKCLAIGPGMGTEESTKELVCRLVAEAEIPLVLDADALNCIADNTDILHQVKSAAIITPHPGEMARLTRQSTREIQSDRVGTARIFAKQYGVHVVLKGARTLIAHPDGMVYVNPTGNPGMASGGMGDVLTGLIAGFLAQNSAPDKAARAGAYIHGAAADTLAEQQGPYGYIATEVMNAVPSQIARLQPYPPITPPRTDSLF